MGAVNILVYVWLLFMLLISLQTVIIGNVILVLRKIQVFFFRIENRSFVVFELVSIGVFFWYAVALLWKLVTGENMSLLAFILIVVFLWIHSIIDKHKISQESQLTIFTEILSAVIVAIIVGVGGFNLY